MDPGCCYEKSSMKPRTDITMRILSIILMCPPNKTLISNLRIVSLSVRFVCSFVNTDMAHSVTLTPRAFRMYAISVWLMSLKTVLTLLERRQCVNPDDKDNVVYSNGGYEKVRWEE